MTARLSDRLLPALENMYAKNDSLCLRACQTMKHAPASDFGADEELQPDLDGATEVAKELCHVSTPPEVLRVVKIVVF